ncbi:MAG TPA: hypothetical protein PK691_06800 [Thermomicrobiales bacterium]|nr:hypothetical protein [Thermomicrobiales bacterium]
MQAQIISPPPLTTPTEAAGIPDFAPGMVSGRVLIRIPNDIDAVLKADPAVAMEWRLAVRRTLPVAMQSGYRATGFVGNIDSQRDVSALILTRELA